VFLLKQAEKKWLSNNFQYLLCLWTSKRRLSWMSAEIFQGGGKGQYFANLCQVADNAMQMSVHEAFYLFYTTPQTKKMPHVTTAVSKMRFVRSHR